MVYVYSILIHILLTLLWRCSCEGLGEGSSCCELFSVCVDERPVELDGECGIFASVKLVLITLGVSALG